MTCSLLKALYNTITSLNFPVEKDSKNIVGEEENTGNQHFLLFLQRFPLIPKGIPVSFRTQIFSCANDLSIYSRVEGLVFSFNC